MSLSGLMHESTQYPCNKGYTQTYGIDYFGTFSQVVRMNSIRILFSIVVNLSLFQLDLKNTLLYGGLQEEVYIEQPSGYIAQGGIKVCPRAWFEKFSLTISVIGFHRCHSDHSVFVRRTKYDIVVLAVYVNILLTGSDSTGLLETTQYLKRHL